MAARAACEPSSFTDRSPETPTSADHPPRPGLLQPLARDRYTPGAPNVHGPATRPVILGPAQGAAARPQARGPRQARRRRSKTRTSPARTPASAASPLAASISGTATAAPPPPPGPLGPGEASRPGRPAYASSGAQRTARGLTDRRGQAALPARAALPVPGCRPVPAVHRSPAPPPRWKSPQATAECTGQERQLSSNESPRPNLARDPPSHKLTQAARVRRHLILPCRPPRPFGQGRPPRDPG